jgi:hypothetical protein
MSLYLIITLSNHKEELLGAAALYDDNPVPPAAASVPINPIIENNNIHICHALVVALLFERSHLGSLRAVQVCKLFCR